MDDLRTFEMLMIAHFVGVSILALSMLWLAVYFAGLVGQVMQASKEAAKTIADSAATIGTVLSRQHKGQAE